MDANTNLILQHINNLKTNLCLDFDQTLLYLYINLI